MKYLKDQILVQIWATIFSWLQFPILEKIDDISSETMLLLWSMKEKHKPNSKFNFYFNALPEAFNTGAYAYREVVFCIIFLFSLGWFFFVIIVLWFLATGLSFGIDAIMVLDGTLLLEEIIEAKNVILLFSLLLIPI